MPGTTSIYQPRKPQESQYYQCVEDHFERLEQVHDEIFAKQYGFFRPYVRQVIYRYLDCGILHNGFARVKRKGCGMNTFLPSRASADISVHLAIKRGWWNSGNGSVKTCLRPYRTVISLLAYPRSSGDTSFITEDSSLS